MITIQGRIAVVYVNLLIFMLHKESYCEHNCDHNFYWKVHSPYTVAHFSAAAPIVLATYRAEVYYFVDTNSYNNRTLFYTLADSMLSSN